MGYGLGGWVSVPARGKKFLSSLQRPDQLWDPPSVKSGSYSYQPPSQLVPRALSLRLKRLGREADHLPPSSAEVKIGGAIPPLSHPSSWRGAYFIKHKNNVTFLYFIHNA
jgi:hypothetical protein